MASHFAAKSFPASMSACFSAGVSGVGSRVRYGSRLSAQSTGAELPVPRGSHATMSKRRRKVLLNAALAASTSVVPGMPGPPGFTSSVPTFWLWSVAGRRSRASWIVPLDGSE